MKLPEFIQKLLKNQGILYLFSGGTSTVVDYGIFYIFYNFIFMQQPINIGFTLTAHTASLLIGSLCGMVVNFIIQRYIVFPESRESMRKRVQFARYIPVSALVISANYLVLKLLVEALLMNANIARALSAALVAIGSFFLNKYFTFRVRKSND